MCAAKAPPGQQRSQLARTGLIGFIGSVVNGAAAFGVVVAVTNGLGDTTSSGTVFLAMAVFNIAYIVCTLGADVAVVRAVARGKSSEVSIVRAALIPTALLSAVVAASITLLRHPIAGLLADGSTEVALARSLLAVGPLIPAASVTTVLIATTRGRGTMTPTAVVERISRPGAQLVLVAAAGLAGLGVASTTLAWSLTFGLALLPALFLFQKGRPAPGTTDDANVGGEYWRFAGPQAITTLLQVTLRWADILFVAALSDAGTAAVYTAASRMLLAGNFVNLAIVQSVSPMVSAALGRDARRDAEDLLQVGTAWLMAAVWPGYLLLISFGPAALGLFGADYDSGGTALAILAGAMLVASAVGPIEAVLLMSGRSKMSLADNAAAVCLNIGLNVVLVPKMGIEGAAIAWGVALLVTNLAPLLQVWRGLAIHPFGQGHVAAALVPLVVIGIPGFVIRLTIDPGLTAVVAFSAAIVVVYLAVLQRFSEQLHLTDLASALKK